MDSTATKRGYVFEDIQQQRNDLIVQREFIEGRIKEMDDLLAAFTRVMDYEANYELRVSEWNKEPLKPGDVKDRTQRQVLVLLAQRNKNWLPVQSAIRQMTDAGIFSPEHTNVSAQVYTLLNNEEWEKVEPGLYKYKGPAKDLPKQGKASVKTGLVDEIAGILDAHPNWTNKDIQDELVRRSWDFGGKKAGSSISISIANLRKRDRAKEAKAGQPSLTVVGKG